MAVTEQLLSDWPFMVEPEKRAVEASIDTKFEIASPIMLLLRVLEPVVSRFPLAQLPTFHLPAQ